MANLITFARLLFLFALLAAVYWAPPLWQLFNPFLLLVLIALDAVDGIVARARQEASQFGAAFDIAVDRSVELVLLVALGHLALIPIWVAYVFIVRSVMVDTIRYVAITEGLDPFSATQHPVGRFLVASRFMRGLYGTAKALAFAWVLLLQPLTHLIPEQLAPWTAATGIVTMSLVYTIVSLCLLRGIPVVVEFLVKSGQLRPAWRVRSPGVPSVPFFSKGAKR